MKKSQAVQASLLAATAAMMAGCSPGAEQVYLNSLGQCVGPGGRYVEQRICYGYGGGYYGGHRYIYSPGRSAPYYSSPSSPGYVRPWASSGGGGSSVGSVGSGTVRGMFGGSAGHGGGGGE